MTSATFVADKQVEKKPVLLSRIRSIDLLRGAVMVLMAIDHVRVYSGLPAGGPAPGIFFTRWVTHFCAPAFVFLAGTSAFLYGRKPGSKSRLAQYLVTRGLLLVVLELTLIRLFWTFNLRLQDFMLAGVIWMLGWCMVLMALLVWLRPAVLGVLGLLIIAFQEIFHYVPLHFPSSMQEPVGRIWNFIYPTDFKGFESINILYVLVPWIGVMALGYAFGAVMTMDAARRRRICLWTGLSAIALFLVLGTVTIMRQPARPDAPPFIMRLLNQRKYPASSLYLLMTLGPLIALVPFAEKAKGWLANVLTVIGKVPFFYYILHILLIHISAIIVNIIRGAHGYTGWYNAAPYASVPPEYQWSLWMLYLVFAIDVTLLYFLCRWYAGYKFSHPGRKWLKYL